MIEALAVETSMIEAAPTIEAATIEAPTIEIPIFEAPAIEAPVFERSVEFPPESPAEEYEAAGEPYLAQSEEDIAVEGIASDDSEVVEEPAEPVSVGGQFAASWQRLRITWQRAPRDLKLITVALPIFVTIAVTGSFPKVPIQTVAPVQVAEVQKAVNDQWKNLTQTISNRAAVAYADDFRSGLDAWEGRSNMTRSWSYDVAGFVRPGPLALFKPSLELTDYRFEFLGEIDQRALGWVFRAKDLKNYYAMKLVVVKPGPLPLVDLVHYAVIDGKPGREVRKPLPMTVRSDMLYRILVDVRGSDFTIMAQDQVVDFWSDARLQHGGVGFFSGRGERARLRWVEVSHQYDALGRVCAYLAPYGLEGRNGSFN
ncbi:MAG TPA: hypothetical protein VME17_14145 [Bryobacteraceae bacterium]|nr:hypothetical protein [Bryobacteraceae bacterium]